MAIFSVADIAGALNNTIKNDKNIFFITHPSCCRVAHGPTKKSEIIICFRKQQGSLFLGHDIAQNEAVLIRICRHDLV